MSRNPDKNTSPPKLSLIIPAYNEAGRIEKTMRHVLQYFDEQDYGAEVIVVDDGSTDATMGIIRGRTATNTVTNWSGPTRTVTAFPGLTPKQR